MLVGAHGDYEVDGMSIQHTIRQPRGETVTLKLTYKSAVKRFCYECTGWDKSAAHNCTAPMCPLFPFRPKSSIVPLDASTDSENALPDALEPIAVLSGGGDKGVEK
jgi:hypothetical protein